MVMKIFLKILITLFFTTKVFCLELTLTKGTVKPTPIAVTHFFSNDSSLKKLGEKISNIISDNLERSGLFIPIDQKAFIQSSKSLSNQPRFEEWKVIKAQHLVSGQIKKNNNKIIVSYKLYDVYQQKLLETKFKNGSLEGSENSWRRIAHMISDAVFQKITGEGGYFDTRIVYVAETGPKDKRIKRLAVMDQDGSNHKFLTPSDYMVLTPRFSPQFSPGKNQDITYMSYINPNKPRVYILNIETGSQEVIGEFEGMYFAPRFSPDGKQLILSYTDPDIGNSEIYVMDIDTRIEKRITNNSGIDVSGSFSPDGNQIVFNSNRSGRRHLYIVGINGENPKRISRESGSYYTPVWSPRGDMIAFTKQEGGQFYIGVMKIDGSNERMIAKSFHVEGPTWSPNGRYLMYFKEERTSADGSGGESNLYSIDLTGYNERKIITLLGGSDPAWSPLMH